MTASEQPVDPPAWYPFEAWVGWLPKRPVQGPHPSRWKGFELLPQENVAPSSISPLPQEQMVLDHIGIIRA